MEVHALRDELAEEKVRLKDATSVGDNKTVSERLYIIYIYILTHDISLVLFNLDKTVFVSFCSDTLFKKKKIQTFPTLS
jgi:hypothetical protein